MTNAQFEALMQLLPKAKTGNGASREAVRMVLVEEKSGVDAAKACQITPAAVSNAVVRARRVVELAKSVCEA